MPFKKEFTDKLEPIREIGYVVSEFKSVASYTEIKITNKNGQYTARVGFVPVQEKDRESIAEKITAYMERANWEKE